MAIDELFMKLVDARNLDASQRKASQQNYHQSGFFLSPTNINESEWGHVSSST